MMGVLRALLVSVLVASAQSSNILFISDVGSPSHHIFNSALVRGLAARGHNVTFVSADVVDNPPKNVHYIHLEKQYAIMYENYTKDGKEMDLSEFVDTPILMTIAMFNGFGYDACTTLARNDGFWKIFNYPDDFKFDLMIYDYTVAPCFLGLLPKFNYPPLIGITAFCNPSSTADILGGDKLGLTVKPHFLLHYDTKDMTIFQRLYNGFINLFESAFRKYYGLPSWDRQMKEIFGADTPFVGDLEKRMQVALINTHPAIEFAESLPPNVIEVGGLQIKDAKPLDDDIEAFVRKGKKGAVLMALGSNYRSDTLGEARIGAIVEAFRQMPDYNFIWKFETSDKLKDLPPNVMIRPWLSQNDILGHESVKAFISHAGMLSTLEAAWHGVPVVGIPLFADQIRNLKKSINAGVAVKVDFHAISTEILKKALREVLDSPKYKQSAEVRSRLFRDQPEKPLDRALWWCEYVMRNPDAPHLRPAEFNFGFFGSHFWDMQVLVVLVILLEIWIFKKLFRRFCRRTKKIERSKKTN